MTTHDDADERLERADPIDAERLIAAWSVSDAKASLLEEITAMPNETLVRETSPAGRTAPATVGADPRRRRTLILAVAAAVVVFAIGISSTFGGSSDPAYAISETADGLVQVNVLAGFRDGDALGRDLRNRGIDARVVTIPASPSMVGSVEIGTEDGPAAGVQTGGPDGTSAVFDWTIDPSVFTGTLNVTVFVVAEDGEAFGAAQEIFEPGEKLGGLHCALGEPMRAADVDRYLVRVGLSAEWTIVTPTADPSVTNSTSVDAVPDGIVLSGYAIDDSTARFDVLADGQRLDVASAGYISDFPCTPEAAAAWR